MLIASLSLSTAYASHRSVDRAGVLRAITQKEHLIGVDPLFECAWRKLALEFATQIQPFRPTSAFQDIFDGLELSTLCNATFAAPVFNASSPLALARSAAASQPPATTLFVDFASGSDANAGTQAAPLQHLAFAVSKARALPKPAALVLRGGVHRLTDTVQLGAADSFLSISAYPDCFMVPCPPG